VQRHVARPIGRQCL